MASKRPRYRSLKPFRIWWDWPRPVDWAAEFGREAPLHLEIGIGNGDWLARQVREHPEWNHLGLELEWGRVMKALRKLHRIDGAAERTRVAAVDARQIMQRLCTPRSLAEITCLFPVPWPLEKHEKHRLFSHDFLELCANRLADGAVLRIVTDAHDYTAWILERIPDAFACAHRSIGATHDTWFEKTWASKGQQEFDELMLTKHSHPDAPSVQDVAMRTHRLDQVDPATVAPANVQGKPAEGGIAIAFKEVVHDAAQKLTLVRAVVVEPDLVQHLWIEVRHQPSDDGWHIRPANGCQFVPTAAVQTALDTVRDAAAATVA
jgi:tRNA (guanine-N7-)-methyltransferase